MIHQILVITPEGLAILDRTYDEKAVDPFLVSGFLAAVIPRMDQFGFTLETLVSEINSSEDTYLSVYSSQGLIFAAIASEQTPKEDTQVLLETIARDVATDILSISQYSVERSQLEEYEDRIDVLVSQQGITASSKMATDSGLLPILNKVFEGKMKPDKAAKLILKAIEKKDKHSIESMKQSLKLLDSMFPKTKGSRMDALQVVIQSTYRGVSKMVVRMDKALSF